LERKAKSGDKEAVKTHSVYVLAKSHLESGKSLRSLDLDKNEHSILSELQLITSKPVMYVCNVDENAVVDGNIHVQNLESSVKSEDAEILILGAGIEADIAELDDYEERQLFLEDLGLKEPGVGKLIKKAYSLLNLQTYFTAGEKEVRAWTINKGMTAPQAAGVIHTDFEKGFIKAEVIKYDDYIKYGSENGVKEAGKLMIQGKEYIPLDGDVMHFRFNV
jgi:GTP-binding protein YchF